MRRGKQACASHARGSGIGRLVGAPGADPGSGSYKLPALPLSYAPCWYPPRESNPDRPLRRREPCPLGQEGGWQNQTASQKPPNSDRIIRSENHRRSRQRP